MSDDEESTLQEIERRKVDQLRSDFAANVSHELKTPLTAIQGFVETLENGAIDDPVAARRFLRIIAQESARLSRLIDDILSLHEIESGLDRRRLPVHPVESVRHIRDMMLPMAQDRGVQLCIELEGDPTILANPDRVKQMLLDLVDNAIKYTPQGGTVTIELSEQGDRVLLEISDTGIGIATEHLSRLFERFYRVDRARSRDGGGTGLGLAIVKHIVADIGGEIAVQSTVGQGTRFLVTLPTMKE